MLLSILALSIAPAHAGAAKAQVCHYNASGSYNLLSVSVGSAHFDAAIHPNDVLPSTVYLDVDGDGLGDPDTATTACPGPLYVDNGDDCDDTDATVGACSSERLFALVSGEIQALDLDTGAASSYLSPALSSAAYHLTWDVDAEVFYALEDAYDEARLTAIDPCDGTVLVDQPVLSTTLGSAHFCEGLDYDREAGLLVAACSFDGTVAGGDKFSETLVDIDVATGEASFLADAPSNGVQNEIDMFVFVGDGEARIQDGDAISAHRWFQTDSSTFATATDLGTSPGSYVAWDWANEALYSITWSTAATPFHLVVQDVDSRETLRSIGSTGLSTNSRGMTFADPSCE